jgi:hypothetical protein
MAQAHVIELALDLARMPALARTSTVPALPPNIIELIRIAAASPEACQAAVAKTGEPTPVVIEAARFYLQQMLFRPEADCYRILGLEPSASRATARTHMRWLLQWLHPDRNNNSWDAVYAERVLRAWREVSVSDGPVSKPSDSQARGPFNRLKKNNIRSIWLPWIEKAVEHRPSAIRRTCRALIKWAVPASAPSRWRR